jgi:cardiolipin synthase
MGLYIFYGILILLALNTLAAAITVLKQQRPVATIWAWLLVLILLPGVGFIVYYFVGRKLSNQNIFRIRNQEVYGLNGLREKYLDENRKQKNVDNYRHDVKKMMRVLFKSDYSILTDNNHVDIYIDGNEKMDQLVKDIYAAKDSVHVQYYIFTDDEVGMRVVEALIDRANAGLEVKLMTDAVGSRLLRKKSIKRMEEAGVQFESFFSRSPFFIFNFRLNWRNHRKIVVIDGVVGYVGGFNVAKEYIGKGPLGYWRDTHFRLTGDAVKTLQSRFMVDWFASKEAKPSDFEHEYFPDAEVEGNTAMQIVSSGPDEESDQIKMGYLQMINLAEEHIYIQTPYFIPDEAVFEAVEMAALAGVEVHIMIPFKPDHPLVYRATEYYVKGLLSAGVHVHKYREDGFMHAKTVCVDGHVASVGTANFDIRSFALNFEINAFVYDEAVVQRLEDIFKKDMEESTKVGKDHFENQSRWKKFRQGFSRLFSPVL